MAITQARMKTLVIAARDSLSAYGDLRRTIAAECKALGADPSLQQLLSALRTIQNASHEFQISNDHAMTIAREETHIKNTERKNAKIAEAQRRRRAAQSFGLSPNSRSTAPNTIGQLSHAAPAPSTCPPSTLSAIKLAHNEMYESVQMTIPYPDPYDDTQPLLPEHGGEREEENLEESLI